MDESKQLLQYSRPFIKPEDFEEVTALMLAGQFDPGPVAQRFRHAVAKKIGVPPSWVCLTNSCTAALEAASWALGGVGAHIDAPVLTWPSTYSWSKSRRLWDVDTNGVMDEPQEANFDTVVFVELWGRRVDWFQLSRFKGKRAVVILDAAQNLFDPNHKQWLCDGLVDAICYSFGPIKQITTGHGGAVVMKDAYEKLRAYCDSGTEGKDKVQPEGRNFEMSEIAAALGLKQLERFDETQKHRWQLLREYTSQYDGMITRPGTHSGHLAVARFPSDRVRQNVIDALFENGVQTAVHYTLPTYLNSDEYPVANELSETVLTIPCHSLVGLTKAREIGALISKVVGERYEGA